MTKQLTFEDMSKKETRRKHAPEMARRMIAILAIDGGWVNRTGMKAHGLNDRECRLGREGSHGRIIAGQKGYKLLRNATPDEIRAAGNAWLAIIKAAQEQYSQLNRRAHKQLNRKDN